MAENGLVQGLVVYYQEQEHRNTPVPYPWTFFLGNPGKAYGSVRSETMPWQTLSGDRPAPVPAICSDCCPGLASLRQTQGPSADNAAIMDVEVLGCWNCIAAVQAHRHYVARVQGQPLNIGVFVDATYDIGRLEDIHFNPWFSSAKPLIYWQTTHGRAFVFGRSDWEYVFNTFAFAYAIGYHFIERGTGSMNGNFLGIGMDSAINASVQVDQSQPYGILITNGEFKHGRHCHLLALPLHSY
eukprot:SAG22_NODE_582_length_8879_cov_2.731663_2_plen_241_part_00